MHHRLKIIQIGNSLGATFPKEMLSALKVEKGDSLTVTPAPDGFRISAYDTEHAEQLEAARKIMKSRRHVLRELAK
jgi:putative addiction module antidote